MPEIINDNQDLPNKSVVTISQEYNPQQINQTINNAVHGTTILFEEGTYRLEKTIEINKSIRLKGQGKSIIEGKNLTSLIDIKGKHTIDIEGLKFLNTNGEMACSVGRVDCKKLVIKNCEFSGGSGHRDDEGVGLLVVGETELEIIESEFCRNTESGLRIEGGATGNVTKCSFRENDSGLVVTDDAPIDAIENYFTENHVGVAYDQSSTGQIRGNSFIENRAGVLVKGNSTASIINNKFAENDIGIALAESCDVLIKENAINEGEWGIKVINNAVALIDNNTIQESSTGIGCLDQSNTKIYNNKLLRNTNLGIIVRNDSTTHIEANTINDNEYGIELNHDVNFRIEKNHVVGNSKYGMYTRRKARGIVHENIIKKNGEGDVLVLDDSDVDFDNYEEPIAPGNPVSYSEVNSQITISEPNNSERVFFKDLLAKIQPETEIVFAVGEYNLSDPIIIDKPIKLIAKTIGEVSLKGDDLPNLLVFEGQGKLSLIGIAFSLESQNQTNVIVIKSGDLEMDKCAIEGGNDPQASMCDFGAGLILLGTSTATVSNSIFKNNILGVSVQEKSSVTLVSNRFTENGYGIVFRDKSTGNLSKNEVYSNSGFGSMVYDNSSIILIENSYHDNKAGLGFKDKTTATAEKNEVFDNEYHGFFIDGDAQCSLKENQSHSNHGSGVAIYGKNKSVIEDNNLYDNAGGIEIGESPEPIIRNNRIYENRLGGIFVSAKGNAIIEGNKIFQNELGISITDKARASIEGNKIYQNKEYGIENTSTKKSTIGNNEEYENGDDYNEDEEDEEGINFIGNIAGIPLGIVVNEKSENDDEGENAESEENTTVYYRVKDSTDNSYQYYRRNEKEDPHWCNVVDENGEYHGDSINWIIIQSFIESGEAEEVTLSEILAEAEKRKKTNT